MPRSNRFAATLAGPLLLAAATAAAQPVPDPRIDQRVEALTRPGEARRDEELEAILTGTDDILLMERRRFFTFFTSAALGYSDNAALSPNARRGDGYLSADLGLRVATQLGGLVDVYAEGSLSTARYFEQTGLDFVALSGAVGAHVAVLGFDLDLAYSPTLVWDGDVETRQLTQHRFSGTLSRAFRVGRGGVRISVGGDRAEADPISFQSTAVTAGLGGIVPLSDRAVIQLGVRGARRWYDNYFEGLLGLERRDWYAEGTLSLAWQLHPNVTVDARISHARNWSTADISRYRVTSGGATLRLAVRF